MTRSLARCVPEDAPGLPVLSSADSSDLARVAPERWARFLRAAISSRSEVVAATLGVTDRAARDWLDAVSGPRLPAVIRAIRIAPDAFAAIVVRGEAALRAVR